MCLLRLLKVLLLTIAYSYPDRSVVIAPGLRSILTIIRTLGKPGTEYLAWQRGGFSREH